ncbi:MAG: hypothetical protein ACYSUV_20570 [Planctomycetota bacterium]|jgi:cytochrome c biogenesis protein CcdA
MSGLFQSRKFWLAVVTFVVDIVILIIGQFFPEWQEFAGQLIASITVLAGVVIAGIAVEDAAALKAGSHPSQE